MRLLPASSAAAQKPLNEPIGSSARLTVARPTVTPALVNSVISWGSSEPRGFVSRLYQPQPGISSKSLANPAMFVESARSAEQAITSGRSYSWRANALTHAPHVASAARLGAFSPGFFHMVGG